MSNNIEQEGEEETAAVREEGIDGGGWFNPAPRTESRPTSDIIVFTHAMVVPFEYYIDMPSNYCWMFNLQSYLDVRQYRIRKMYSNRLARRRRAQSLGELYIEDRRNNELIVKYGEERGY